MKPYETTVIAAPNLSEEELNQVIASNEQVIAGGGGKILSVERWGKRRLAYRVKKFEDGIYYLLYYEAPSPVVQELERRIRIEDKLLRFLTVAVDWDRKIIPVAEAPAEGPVAEDRAGVAEGPVGDQPAGEEAAGAEDAMSTGDYVT